MINLPVMRPQDFQTDPMGGMGGLLQQALAQFNQQRQSNDQHGLNNQNLQDALLKSQYLPIDKLIQLGDLQRKTNRFGKSYDFIKRLQLMPPAARASFIADNNPQFLQEIHNIENDMGNDKGGFDINSALSNAIQNSPLSNYFSQQNSNEQNPNQQNNTIDNQQQPAIAQDQNVNNNIKINPKNLANALSGDSEYLEPEENYHSRLTTQMEANRKSADKDIYSRYQAGKALENFVESPEAKDMFKILSNGGWVNKVKREIEAGTGNAEDKLKYNNAINQFSTLVSGSLKRLEGLPTSSEGLKKGLDYFNKANDLIVSDPIAAMKYFNQGIDLIKSETKALKKQALPVYPYADEKRISKRDVQETAKKSGLTVEQVINKLKEQGRL